MKYLLTATLLFTLQARAIEPVQLNSTEMSTLVTFMSSMQLNSSSSGAQQRGVGEVEQLNDEMASFLLDLDAGQVDSLEDLRQPMLEEFFASIAADETLMSELRTHAPESSDVTLVVAYAQSQLR